MLQLGWASKTLCSGKKASHERILDDFIFMNFLLKCKYTETEVDLQFPMAGVSNWN